MNLMTDKRHVFQYLSLEISIPDNAVEAIKAHPEFEQTQRFELNRSLAFLTFNEFNTFVPDEDEIASSSDQFREQMVLMSIWLLAKGVVHYPVDAADLRETSDTKRLH